MKTEQSSFTTAKLEITKKINVTKKILVVCFSNLSRDPRVYRQIIFLKDNYEVIAAGFNSPQIDGVEFVQLQKGVGNSNYFSRALKLAKLLSNQGDAYYWGKAEINYAYNELIKIDYDLILANDLDSLPLAVRLAHEKNAKLIYDAHEYSPREFEDNLKWRILWQKYKGYLCRKYLPRANAVITVCDEIASEYKKNFHVDPILITNAPLYEELTPQVVGNKIKMIHHGAAIPGRKLELMIELMALLDDRYTLDLMLMPNDEKYLKGLKERAKINPRINFIDPVPMPLISKVINSYDVGIFILESVNFNWKMALPNKLFEFIQGRLMIFIGPSIEMVKYVNKYKLGIATPDFNLANMAKILNQLKADEIHIYKQNCHKYAYELSANKNKEILVHLVESLLAENK